MDYKIQLIYDKQNVNFTLTENNVFDQLCNKIKDEFNIQLEEINKTYIFFSNENGKSRLVTNEQDINQIILAKGQSKDIIINIIKGNEELKNKLKQNKTVILAESSSSQIQNSINDLKKNVISNNIEININDNNQNKETIEETTFDPDLVEVLSLVMNSIDMLQTNNSQIETIINMNTSNNDLKEYKSDQKVILYDHQLSCVYCSNKIVGKRMKCYSCPEYDICYTCYLNNEKKPFHSCSTFLTIANSVLFISETQSYQNKERSELVNIQGNDSSQSIKLSYSKDSQKGNPNTTFDDDNNLTNQREEENCKLKTQSNTNKKENDKENQSKLFDQVNSNEGNKAYTNSQSVENPNMHVMEDYKSQVSNERVKLIDEMIAYFSTENISIKKKEQDRKEINDKSAIQHLNSFIEFNNGQHEYSQQIAKNIDYAEIEIQFKTQCKRITVLPCKSKKSNILSKVIKISMKEKKITFCFEKMSLMHDSQILCNYFCEIVPYNEDAYLDKNSLPHVLYQINLLRIDEN